MSLSIVNPGYMQKTRINIVCIKIIPSVVLRGDDVTRLKMEIELTGSEFDRNANELEILREMDRLKKRLIRITENYSFTEVKQ